MTTPAQIDHDTATVTRTVRIEAAPELVWAALTTPAQIAQWFGQRADFPDGVHAGATGSFGWTGDADLPVQVDVHDPHHRFAFTWGAPGEPLREDNSTTATFTLSGDGEATTLTVVETGFDTLSGGEVRRRAALADHAAGWESEVDELVARVTTLQTTARPVADVDAGTISHSVLITADVATVWDALVDPQAIEAWWGHPARFPDGVRAGSLGTFEWVGHGLMPIRVERVEAPTRFDLRWGELGDSEPGPDASLVEFTVTPVAARTLVTVVETGFRTLDGAARRAAMEDNVTGWSQVLGSLAAHTARRAA